MKNKNIEKYLEKLLDLPDIFLKKAKRLLEKTPQSFYKKIYENYCFDDADYNKSFESYMKVLKKDNKLQYIEDKNNEYLVALDFGDKIYPSKKVLFFKKDNEEFPFLSINLQPYTNLSKEHLNSPYKKFNKISNSAELKNTLFDSNSLIEIQFCYNKENVRSNTFSTYNIVLLEKKNKLYLLKFKENVNYNFKNEEEKIQYNKFEVDELEK